VLACPVINATHKAAPAAIIAFNTRPEDSADAAARWCLPAELIPALLVIDEKVLAQPKYGFWRRTRIGPASLSNQRLSELRLKHR